VNIYIDESGSFVNASSNNAWNAVAALAVPEASRRLVTGVFQELHSTRPPQAELKIRDIPEDIYLQFVEKLGRIDLALFCTATDAGLNTTDRIKKHQTGQVSGVLEHIDKMKHKTGRDGVLFVASQLSRLSPQLYVQLHCQIDLIFDVISRVIPYYAQRNPGTLREFRWRIDRKNNTKTDFEDAFEKLSPALLQTRSIEEPLMTVKGFDYSRMGQYEFEDGKPPEYLKDTYGIDVGSALDVQKLIRGDIKFEDSTQSYGLQLVDLIVSGIRRCLRLRFVNNERAARALGKLLIQAKHNGPSINLLSFGDKAVVDKATARVIHTMSACSKRMMHN
jgi:hypothetical protein